ncbi:MAG: hypothetical protein U1E70_27080, partial [Acetobacteraceae bacterium]
LLKRQLPGVHPSVADRQPTHSVADVVTGVAPANRGGPSRGELSRDQTVRWTTLSASRSATGGPVEPNGVSDRLVPVRFLSMPMELPPDA